MKTLFQKVLVAPIFIMTFFLSAWGTNAGAEGFGDTLGQELNTALTLAQDAYGKVQDYEARFEKREEDGGVLGLPEKIFFKYEKPFKIFMNWLDGPRSSISEPQRRSWGNLTILNEWKRRYPDRDPIEIHRRFWGVELLCPGGGQYVWNEKDRTMESTVFGHPLAPKQPDQVAAQTPLFESLKFGLTFELGGLRTRVEVERPKPAE